LRLILPEEALARVKFVRGDITDLEALAGALAASEATHLIHLAALQVPFCKADPPLGARVNVGGTIHVFEAAKRAGLQRLVYASSVAVFGAADDYSDRVLRDDAPAHPHTLYGVYKVANEGAARIYWQDAGIASVGLRPHTLYGPGRDQGLTSSPTTAMLAAAAGRPFHIPFGGRGTYHYASDAARMFIQAARADSSGAAVYNLPGSLVHVREIVAAIEAAEPASRGQITHAEVPLPLAEGVDGAGLRALLGAVPCTPLDEGVAETLVLFRRALADGRLPSPAA
jgi:nucleoside-diphosphate-sugar epimerase